MAQAPATTVLRTQLGPLTTTFVPPSDCSSLLWYPYNSEWHGYQGHSFQCGYRTYISTSTIYKLSSLRAICYPSGFASYMNQPLSLDVAPGTGFAHFYSPGLVCPAGYTTACTVARQTGVPLPRGDPSGVWSHLSAGETAIGCCPSGYNCNDAATNCLSTATKGEILRGPVYDCDDKGKGCTGGCTITLTDMTTTSKVDRPTIVAYAALIRLVQKKSDFTDPNAEQSTSTSTISPGAYAGIGAGVAIAVVGLLGFCFWFLLWRRKKQKGVPTADSQPQPQPINHLPMQDTNLGQNAQVHSPWEMRVEPTRMNVPNGPGLEAQHSVQNSGWQAPQTNTRAVEAWAYENGTELEARAIPIAELSAKEKENISNDYNRTS